MDDQNKEIAVKVKEAKQKVLSAKDKVLTLQFPFLEPSEMLFSFDTLVSMQEKSLKQKMKDDIAKAIIAKHGAPLSISEHEALVSHIKRKTAEAHNEVLASKGMFLESKYSSYAHLPIFLII